MALLAQPGTWSYGMHVTLRLLHGRKVLQWKFSCNSLIRLSTPLCRLRSALQTCSTITFLIDGRDLAEVAAQLIIDALQL